MSAIAAVKSFWWLVKKDLTREARAHSIWPPILLLGLVLIFVLAGQLDLPADETTRLSGAIYWLAVAFAGTLAFERSISIERDAGCWRHLTLSPVQPSVVFLAKMATNLAALSLAEIVLAPVLIALTDVPLLARPAAFALVALLGSIGLAAIGTLLSAVTVDLHHRSGLIALLFLPFVTPVVTAAAEATKLAVTGPIDRQWWLWVQLLVVFAVVFTTLGALVFEVVIEE